MRYRKSRSGQLAWTVALVAAVLIGGGGLTACNGQSGSSTPAMTDTGSWSSKLAKGDYESIKKLQTMGVDALPLLITLLQDPNDMVVAMAAKVVGPLKLQAAPAVPYLMEALRRQGARTEAEYALVDIGEGAIPELAAAIGGSDPELRKYALKVLSRGFGKKAAGASKELIMVVQTNIPDQEKINAILALASIGTAVRDQAMPVLAELANGEGEVAKQAGMAFKRLEVANRPGAYTDSR